MKYRTLAVLAFAGMLAVSGAAFAKSEGTNDPTPDRPFDEMQRVRKHTQQQQEDERWPVFKPGTGRWPDRTKDDRHDRRPPERPKDDRHDRRPPERPKDGVRPNRPPERPKDDRRDERPHPLPRDGHKRKVPPEYKQ